MRLPNYDKAYVSQRKLLDYLLSETHPIGKSKAKFLRSIGFGGSNLDALEQSLISIAQSKEVIELVKRNKPDIILMDIRIIIRTIWVMLAGKGAR